MVNDVANDNQITIQKNLDNGNVTCESAKDAITKAELIWAINKGRTDMGYKEHVFTF